MALVNCPECQHEISDTLSNCPHCGYQLKPASKGKKALLPLIIVLVVIVCVVVGFLVYTNVIKPNQVMDQAEYLFERGKYSDAEILLASIPYSSRKTEILSKIGLEEALTALKSGDLDLAEEKLAFVSLEYISPEMLYSLNTQKAEACLLNGMYAEADALYAELEQTPEIVEIRKEIFEESRVLQCALMVKDALIYPDSIRIEEVAYFEPRSSVDESQSTDETEVRVFNEPDILLHYSAQNRGGGSSDGFVMFDWNDGEYEMGTMVDDLDTEDEPPSYYDYEERKEFYSENEAKLIIQMALLSFSYDLFEDERLERLTVAAANCKDATVELIPYNEVVPQPTPEIIQLTPALSSTPESTHAPLDATPESTHAPAYVPED